MYLISQGIISKSNPYKSVDRKNIDATRGTEKGRNAALDAASSYRVTEDNPDFEERKLKTKDNLNETELYGQETIDSPAEHRTPHAQVPCFYQRPKEKPTGQ